MRVPQDLERFRELPMAVVYRSAADGGAKPKCVWNWFQYLQGRCVITRTLHRDGTRRGSRTVGHVVRHGGSAVAEPGGQMHNLAGIHPHTCKASPVYGCHVPG